MATKIRASVLKQVIKHDPNVRFRHTGEMMEANRIWHWEREGYIAVYTEINDADEYMLVKRTS